MKSRKVCDTTDDVRRFVYECMVNDPWGPPFSDRGTWGLVRFADGKWLVIVDINEPDIKDLI